MPRRAICVSRNRAAMRLRSTLTAAALSAASLVLLGAEGCVDVLPGRELPQTHYYTLDYAIPQGETTAPNPATIRVNRVSVDPSVKRLNVVLRRREPSQEVVPFNYHRW